MQTTIITAGPYNNNTGNWLFNSYSQTVNYKAEAETFTYDLFQDVYIVLNDPNDFSVLSLGSPSGAECLIVPAFYLPLIAQNQIDVYQEELFQNSILAVNIASTAIGAGSLYNAYKVGRYGLAVFEFINLGVDVMDLTGVSNSVIPSEYQPYVNTFQIALGSYGLFIGKTTKEIAQSSSRPLLDENFVSATIHLRNNIDDLPLDLQKRVGFTYNYLKAKGFINAAGEVVQGAGNNLDELLATVKNSCNADELAELAQDAASFNLAKTQPQQFINGKNFERGIGNLIDNGDQAFLNQVANHANVNLAQYTPIKQLQINLPNGGYMIADNAWVKQINVGGQVQFEVILNECKLSSAAPWTTRQTELLNSLNGGNITFTSRSAKAEIANVIPQNSTIKIKTVVKTEGTGSGHTVTKVY